MWPAFEQLEALAGVSAASALTGIPRSSVYRWRAADRRPFGPPRAPAPKVMPSALTEAERADVLAVLDSDRFADKAPAQVWAMLLDEGRYLCSVSSMYRILRSAQQVRERRAVATHPPRVKPQLLATGPSQVFSCARAAASSSEHCRRASCSVGSREGVTVSEVGRRAMREHLDRQGA